MKKLITLFIVFIISINSFMIVTFADEFSNTDYDYNISFSNTPFEFISRDLDFVLNALNNQYDTFLTEHNIVVQQRSVTQSSFENNPQIITYHIYDTSDCSVSSFGIEPTVNSEFFSYGCTLNKTVNEYRVSYQVDAISSTLNILQSGYRNYILLHSKNSSYMTLINNLVHYQEYGALITKRSYSLNPFNFKTGFDFSNELQTMNGKFKIKCLNANEYQLNPDSEVGGGYNSKVAPTELIFEIESTADAYFMLSFQDEYLDYTNFDTYNDAFNTGRGYQRNRPMQLFLYRTLMTDKERYNFFNTFGMQHVQQGEMSLNYSTYVPYVPIKANEKITLSIPTEWIDYTADRLFSARFFVTTYNFLRLSKDNYFRLGIDGDFSYDSLFFHLNSGIEGLSEYNTISYFKFSNKIPYKPNSNYNTGKDSDYDETTNKIDNDGNKIVIDAMEGTLDKNKIDADLFFNTTTGIFGLLSDFFSWFPAELTYFFGVCLVLLGVLLVKRFIF